VLPECSQAVRAFPAGPEDAQDQQEAASNLAGPARYRAHARILRPTTG